MLDIAKGQLLEEDKLIKLANKVLICDTNLIVIKVWDEHKFGACYPEIIDWIKERKYDLYLLTNIDVPWQDDPQREHPHLRSLFMDIYREEIKKTGIPWVEISGESHFERQSAAVNAINALLAGTL